MSQTNHINVEAKGFATGHFTSATFAVETIATSATGPAAKEKLTERMDAFKKVLLDHATTAGIKTDEIKTTLSVEPHMGYDADRNQIHKGYKATYTAKFTAANIQGSLALHDALTSLQDFKVESPTYQLGESEQLRNHAFADGVKNAIAKFAAQCAALGIYPNAYEAVSWYIEEENRPSGKMLSYTADATPKAVEVKPGKAMLTLTVHLVYAKRVIPPGTSYQGM